MEEKEKFGTIIVNGKMVNLDTAPLDELKQHEDYVKAKIHEKKEKIKKMLFDDHNDADELEK